MNHVVSTSQGPHAAVLQIAHVTIFVSSLFWKLHPGVARAGLGAWLLCTIQRGLHTRRTVLTALLPCQTAGCLC